MEQALLLRGSRDSPSLEDYKQYPRLLLAQLNAGRRERVKTEMQYLRALPDARLESSKRVQVEARLTAETVEVWYARQKVEPLPRLRGRGKHRVDYRHIIDWLVRKPGAFSTIDTARSCFRLAGSA